MGKEANKHQPKTSNELISQHARQEETIMHRLQTFRRPEDFVKKRKARQKDNSDDLLENSLNIFGEVSRFCFC